MNYKICGIYKIVNEITNEIYIGQSINIEQRIQKHMYTASKYDGLPFNRLYHAISKYGYLNFSYEVLEECPVEDLDNKEMYYISLYNSYRDGYNMNIGGPGFERGENNYASTITEDIAIEVIDLLENSNLSQKQIAGEFEISGAVVTGINTGRTWSYLRIGKTYPIRSNLIHYCRQCGEKVSWGAKLCMKCIKGVYSGERSNNHKLSNQDVLEIVNLLENTNITHKGLAGKYGVEVQAIERINNGETWRYPINKETYPIRISPNAAKYFCRICGKKCSKQCNYCIDCVGKARSGENNPNTKLTEDIVMRIKHELKNKNWKSMNHISKEFNTSHSTVTRINRGLTWRDCGNYIYPIR